MANKTSTFKEYFNTIMTDILPPSAIKAYKLNKIGLYSVTNRDAQILKSEGVDLGDASTHEKSAPDKFLLKRLDKENTYSPTYLKYFQDPAMFTKLSKIIVNSALQLYPNPLNSYGVLHEQGSSYSVGVATIDLNSLKNEESDKHVDSTRLDKVLQSLGLNQEINCFMDFQKLVENEAFTKAFTPRAIVQLGLASIFIPNPIGETDVNSRNIMLLKSANGEQYDSVVRIDADANVYLSEVVDRGKVDCDAVPKGIFGPNEPMDEYLKNISSKDSNVDWDLFMGFTLLAKEATSRTSIDNAVTKSYMMNSGKLDTPSFVQPSPFASNYNAEAFYAFSEATIKRAENFSDNVLDAIGGRGLHTIPPFAEHISKYPNIVVENTPSSSLVQEDQTFNQ